MSNFILFDDTNRTALLPFTFLRPVSTIRVGILTIAEKWKHYLNSEISYLTEPYLQQKFKLRVGTDNILINASILPNARLIKNIMLLKADSALMYNRCPIAVRLTAENLKHFSLGESDNILNIECEDPINQIINTWDIIRYNKKEIENDFDILTTGKVSETISKSNTLFGNQIFIEQGASVEGCHFDTRNGPVYIGKNAIVMPGTVSEGHVAVGEHATIKMGAHLYGGASIGPWCKAAGEISNSILTAFSAKAHDGYLGDSLIGEWCNLGAGTTTSNLKNNYEPVKQWSYRDNKFIDTGLQFCGLIMGDYSKSGILTMFNSGTTTGVCTNIFGPGFQRNFISSFSWGGTSGFRKHKPEEVISTAKAMYARRNLILTETEEQIISEVFRLTSNNKYL